MSEARKKSNTYWRHHLTEAQYRVTREAGTEAPFSGVYCHFNEYGHYHCICCDALLFHSTSKFEAGCGWPSFAQEAQPNTLHYIEDRSHGMVRTEVRCAQCDAHLGHVFNDGPPPSGLRYCINSVALQFRPSALP